MPIAQKPGGSGGGTIPLNQAEINYTNVISAAGVGAGVAVAIVQVVSQLEYIPCDASPTGYSEAFAGFTAQVIIPGGHGQLIVGRGSLVTPVVEGGAPLIPGQEVFLSLTPGEVTQTPVSGPGEINLRLGAAVSTTQLLLTTDAYYKFGG